MTDERKFMIKELDRWIKACQPNIVMGDEDSIFPSDWQEGYLSALKEVKGKLLGAE